MRTYSVLVSLWLLASCATMPTFPTAATGSVPGLPRASGPRLLMGEARAAPNSISRFLLSLPEQDVLVSKTERQRYLQRPVLVQRVSGRGDSPDYLVVAQNGADYGFWVRSFRGDSAALTGYLVSIQGLCAELLMTVSAPIPAAARQCKHDKYFDSGIRAYLVVEGHPPLDVTSTIAPDPRVAKLYRKHYEEMGANPIRADEENLDQVPVLRWVVGFDPENTSASPDPPIFDGGHYAHAGFVVWNGERFDQRKTVPRALWPCRAEGRTVSCPSRTVDGDPFVTE